MKHFKDKDGKTYGIEAGFEHLLPEGCEEITIEEARELSTQNQPKPDPKIEAANYLASTDWYVIRKQETKKAIPKEVADKRAQARAILSGETE